MFVFMFFCIGAFFIISENNMNLSRESFSNFSGLYIAWLDQLVGQFGSYTGYVVHMDWLPKNVTTE